MQIYYPLSSAVASIVATHSKRIDRRMIRIGILDLQLEELKEVDKGMQQRYRLDLENLNTIDANITSV